MSCTSPRVVANCKNGISSWEIHRSLGVTQKTAWFLLHRVRLAMKSENDHKMGSGDGGAVEIDETFVGGKLKNMHKVRAKVVKNVKRETLQNEILKNIHHGSTVYSDQAVSYDKLKENYIHETVNHVNAYVEGNVHTNSLENFWSLMKRNLSGTYIAVEPFHLDAYLDEQMFRYNNRATKDNPLNDADRFALVVSQIVGRRLTYKELTGKTEEARPV
jgi:transposase-like protein